MESEKVLELLKKYINSRIQAIESDMESKVHMTSHGSLVGLIEMKRELKALVKLL